ncbi:MAG: UDP-N-acetylmuramoyl-tripeptide--D-alanyl-D-alanine ligase [Bdellovibrionales bacterium]|nr:UDP-N-acetylmuramoyl-tripeptide--D-alanyl-D-alanine ligase [Bdellovibrionales bacterium]
MTQKMEDSFPFKAAWIAEVLSLPKHPGDDEHRFHQFITDSRKVTQSSLFVAIRGEKMDGHDFIPKAIADGATAVLAEESVILSRKWASEYPQARFFGVTDVQEGFRKIASAWRKRFSIPVILVAGSNGKTTTKEFLSAILQGKYRSVLKTQGSQNGFLGIPMTLIELRSHHQAAVIEVGIDEVGAMAQHVPLVHPTHTLLTLIGPEHLEKLIDLPTVAREEILAFHETQRIGGQCIVNLNDPWIAPVLPALREAWSFSIEPTAHRKSKTCLVGQWSFQEGMSRLETSVGEATLTLEVPLPGKHNAQNLQAALTTAACLGLSAEEIQKGMSLFQGAEGRSQIRPLPFSAGTHVICDYYNASPVSMDAAFSLLAQTGQPHSTRIACLADMKELGTEELQFHAALAPALMRSGVSTVLLHGTRMKSLLDSLRALNFKGKLLHFEDLHAMTQELRKSLVPGSVVLIKGSRSMKMETIWMELQKT